MQSNAKISGVAASPIQPAAGASAPGGNPPRQQPTPDEQARYRLVIEEGPRAGSFVYKTMDRVTGEVVRQFPREDVMGMMNAPGYGSGTVIDTTA